MRDFKKAQTDLSTPIAPEFENTKAEVIAELKRISQSFIQKWDILSDEEIARLPPEIQDLLEEGARLAYILGN